MAARAEALVREDRPRRPDLRVIPGGGERPERRAAAGRRLVALAAVAVVACVAGLVLAPGSRDVGNPSPAAGAPAQGEELTVVVAPGDTVWDLAREHLPEGIRPGDYAADILAANDLDATALRPGTVVRLPAAPGSSAR